MNTAAKRTEYQNKSRDKRRDKGDRFINVWVKAENVAKLDALRDKGAKLVDLVNRAIEGM